MKNLRLKLKLQFFQTAKFSNFIAKMVKGMVVRSLNTLMEMFSMVSLKVYTRMVTELK